MGKVKSFRLDDDTIIYVQSDEDVDTTEITQVLETPDSSDLEDDLELPEPSAATPPSDPDADEELEEYGAKSKAWYRSNRHSITGVSNTEAASSTPAQRIGSLVNTYTTHVVQDIRNTALTDVQVKTVKLEFGIGLDTTAQIPYIASSSAKCSVKVTIECEFKSPKTTQDSELSSENLS